MFGPSAAAAWLVLLALAAGVAVFLVLGVVACQHRRGRWRADDA